MYEHCMNRTLSGCLVLSLLSFRKSPDFPYCNFSEKSINRKPTTNLMKCAIPSCVIVVNKVYFQISNTTIDYVYIYVFQYKFSCPHNRRGNKLKIFFCCDDVKKRWDIFRNPSSYHHAYILYIIVV